MPNKLQIKFIKDAMDAEHLLTEWEAEFINNIADLEDDKDLSQRQNTVLNRIITKVNRGEER